LDVISFSPPGRFVDQLRECSNIHLSALQYRSLPNWLCEGEVWSKNGLFVDTTKIDHMVSEGYKFKRKYQPEDVSIETINFFWQLELQSRRVILQDDKHKELVFYLSYVDNNWYLTIIDKASSDCSI
jgi:hypothetical protein